MLRRENREQLANTGIIIYLKTDVAEQLKRTGRSRTRPLLLADDPRQVLEKLSQERTPIYEQLADITIDTGGKRVKTVAAALKDTLEQRDLLPLQT